MNIYIRSTSNISPQKTFGQISLTEQVDYNEPALRAIEPDYNSFIDARLIRRMSRTIRMGAAAASQCLQDAGEKNPSAIITGTAYGCLEDSGRFLNSLIEQEEQMLSPTSFIQSTHNTVGAQIALLLQCTSYNNTFVHGAFSFESALLDSILLLKENEAETVLTGSIDEITDFSYSILQRFGLFKREPVSNLSLLASNTKGTISGEGAAFFLLAHKPSKNDYAQLDAVSTLYKPKTVSEIEFFISRFLEARSMQMDQIDLIISGRNGNTRDDQTYDSLEKTIFKDIPTICYKHLCGEFPTSISFAFWLAAGILKTGTIPSFLQHENITGKRPNRILIYNHYQNTHHSILLLSAC